ncbi:MAG: hypothetical protein CMJ90_05410 [Planctomycetes bacterium]|nr:hypothetical protein [Planctomycetota bacterium]
MTLFRRPLVALFAFAVLCGFASPALAQKHKELGRMWTFENVPLDFMKEAYGFEPSQQWLDHARMSSLRYGNGCSASFVSPRGLIMTNNHCTRDNVVSVSPEDKDWLNNGFFANSLAEEVPVPGLVVRQLVKMTNVTERVQKGESAKDIEAAAKEKDENLEAQVVSLYQGGMYQLYQYKVFRDIRLVAFPHLQAAKFGGDPDNFTFPRYSLDYAFMRAYEDGKPADTSKHHFGWRTEGPNDGEAVFVTGNPGSTGRLNTVAQMEFLRDAEYPLILANSIKRPLGQLYSREKGHKDKGEPVPPKLTEEILGLENARKAYTGFLDGLKNEAVMDVKRKAEKAIREKVDADAGLKEKYGDAWTRLEEICAEKTLLVADRPSGWRNKFGSLQSEEKKVAKSVGEAFFAVYGTEIPPDATFTLRISDGVVRGFPMNGTIAPWFTSLYGLYGRHTEFGGKDPFNMPEVWMKRLHDLDLKTRVNLVSTNDIVGGNSGSPMIDTKGRIVGLVFDGNIESLGNKFVFTDDVPRTVSVHPHIIIESLRKVYDRPKLADEIEGKGKGYK